MAAEDVLASAHAALRHRMLLNFDGLGTGVTAGEFTLYPDVETIDVAEISPAVVEFAGLFATEDQTIGMRSFLASGPGKAEFVGR